MADPSASEQVLDLLKCIPGVRLAAQVPDDLRRRAVEREAAHERASVLPVRNLGVRLLAERAACFAILKDGTFRSPGAATVYLVEEDAPQDCANVLVVGNRRYAVVGEELVEGRPAPGEPTIPVERSFVIFPERRRGPHVPCTFILPPVRFPEIEREAGRLGVMDVVSISPSLASDELLRAALGFPPTNDLATLLIGFNWAPGRAPASS